MTSDVNSSRRPSLEPIWTNYYNLGGAPRTAFRPVSPGLSPSPMSPKSLPSPLYPAPYDGSMRRQDRALVNSLDQRTRIPSFTNNAAPLTPIDEDSPSPLVARLEKISILPPINMKHGLPTPASPELSPQRDSIHGLERSRTIAARGLPEIELRRPSNMNDRPVSMTPISPPPPPPPPRRHSVLGLREQLQSWGHIYYGNAKTADAFIIARSLRRHSNPSSINTATPSSESVSPGTPNRLTVRAIIRPRAMERQSFLIQRNFDVDELRATVPDPPPQPAATRPAGGVEEGGPMPHSAPLPAPGSRRRSSSVRSSALLLSPRDMRSNTVLDHEILMREAKAIPIHLKYARAHLPVIAALLVSGHVREGDVVYLPMPHAEAWPQTARYVYTGQGELTQAVRENILYLAGKV